MRFVADDDEAEDNVAHPLSFQDDSDRYEYDPEYTILMNAAALLGYRMVTRAVSGAKLRGCTMMEEEPNDKGIDVLLLLFVGGALGVGVATPRNGALTRS